MPREPFFIVNGNDTQPPYNMKFLFLVLVPFTFAHAADMQFVTVGNPGNPSDSSGYGAVDHIYRIGKFEVSNEGYAEFLNATVSD